MTTPRLRLGNVSFLPGETHGDRQMTISLKDSEGARVVSIRLTERQLGAAIMGSNEVPIDWWDYR